MKSYSLYLVLFLALCLATTQNALAQSNNEIDIYQGGVNSFSLIGTNNEAYVDQTAESGTINSKVIIQQAGDSQYADIEQANVDNSITNTYQEADAGNTINIAQLDGENLWLFGRQALGSENTIAAGQTGANNGAAVLQNGNGNTALVGQSGFNNRTATAANLNALHLKFLTQSNYDPAAYDPGGAGYTDGIVQIGDDNIASLSQSGDNNEAYIFQHGDQNNAAISQAGSHDKSCILQRGTANIAQTNQ